MPIAIIVHGGAGTAAPERHDVLRAGCKEAATVGWRVVRDGGSALDAVEAAVRALEDNPNFNAGTGAMLTREGKVELDAGIMEGRTLSVGAVAAVELIKNPISLARKVLESPHALLMGKGAHAFAQEHDIALCRLEDLITERQYQLWQQRQQAGVSTPSPGLQALHPYQSGGSSPAPGGRHGTVGAVALDMQGALAAATSTGGIMNKYPGRIGDSPLVGCGFYADEHAAVSCTGDGEDFIRLLIARRAADFVARGDTARAAAEAAIAVLSAKAEGTGGLIVVDRLGNIGFAWNSRNLSRAYMYEGLDEPASGI